MLITSRSKILKLAIFDWAGTMVDIGSKAPLEAFKSTFQKTYKRFGMKKTDEEILQYMGMDKKLHLNNLTGNKQITEYLYPILLSEMKTNIFKYSKPVAGIDEVFSFVKKNEYLIGSTSGYSRVLLNIAIERAKMEGMIIPFNVASDEVLRPRPFSDMIEKNKLYHKIQYFDTLNKKINKKEYDTIFYKILKIGDTPIDIEEGINSRYYNTISIETIGITTSFTTKKQMLEKGADYVINDIRDIKNFRL